MGRLPARDRSNNRPAAGCRRGTRKTLVTPPLAAALASAIPGWRVQAPRLWCAEKRGCLPAPDCGVVWERDEKVLWALWGAEHGFFELGWAYHLPYLRAAATAP